MNCKNKTMWYNLLILLECHIFCAVWVHWKHVYICLAIYRFLQILILLVVFCGLLVEEKVCKWGNRHFPQFNPFPEEEAPFSLWLQRVRLSALQQEGLALYQVWRCQRFLRAHSDKNKTSTRWERSYSKASSPALCPELLIPAQLSDFYQLVWILPELQLFQCYSNRHVRNKIDWLLNWLLCFRGK